MNRADLEAIPEQTHTARHVRYATDTDVGDLSDDDLRKAAEWFDLASHDFREAAGNLRRILYRRSLGGTKGD